MPYWNTVSEQWMQRQLEELHDHLGAIVALDTEGNSTWRSTVRAVSLGQNIYYLNRILNKYNLPFYDYPGKILLREIHRKNISHVICHYGEFATDFMNIWQKTDVPLFIHFHGYDVTFDLKRYNQPNKPYFSDTYINKIKQLSERATFIANSNFTKSLLLKIGIPEDTIKVKHLGVPIPKYTKLHQKSEDICILHLGRLIDCKSPDRTIKAFEIARSKGMKGSLIIAGDGELRKKCEELKLISPYGNSIKIIGAVESILLESLFLQADIFTQHNIKGEITNQEEAFGVSVIEAMSYGLPVVGTRSGGVTETVIENETGILVNPNDVIGQAEAFLKLAEEPALRNQYGSAGRRRVENYFSMDLESRNLKTILKL